MTGSDFGDVSMTIRLALSLQEEHHKQTIYACRFCDNIPAYADYFATVAGTWVSVYRVTSTGIDGGVKVDLEQAFSDADAEEFLYCVTWASTGSNVPVLMVAGKQGTIKGIMMSSPFELRSILLGHGDSVYDLRTHPVDDGLVLSASKDESIRLWNVRTSVCIAVFAGAGGHRGAVLAIDIHPLGNVFASSGMDTTIKIWNLEKPDLCSAIDLSDSNPRGPAGNHNFRSVSQQDPLYSTNQVHMNYVDSVKWVGDFLLTKATGEAVTLWAPDSTRYAGAALILRTFHLPLFKIWYAQMDVFAPFDVFCVGNDDGRVSSFLRRISLAPAKVLEALLTPFLPHNRFSSTTFPRRRKRTKRTLRLSRLSRRLPPRPHKRTAIPSSCPRRSAPLSLSAIVC